MNKFPIQSNSMPQGMENDNGQASELLRPAPVKNYMTPTGYQRLRDELKTLIEEERPEVVKVVSWAASNGDRSENGDYIYGKKRLREIDKRIRFLNRRLAYAQIIDPARQENVDRIYFGATVTLRDADGNVYRYQIVGIDEANPEEGTISWDSPMGRGLVGHEIGDFVFIGEGKVAYEVIGVRYVVGG